MPRIVPTQSRVPVNFNLVYFCPFRATEQVLRSYIHRSLGGHPHVPRYSELNACILRGHNLAPNKCHNWSMVLPRHAESVQAIVTPLHRQDSCPRAGVQRARPHTQRTDHRTRPGWRRCVVAPVA